VKKAEALKLQDRRAGQVKKRRSHVSPWLGVSAALARFLI
jgi:hypothetical protein